MITALLLVVAGAPATGASIAAVSGTGSAFTDTAGPASPAAIDDGWAAREVTLDELLRHAEGRAPKNARAHAQVSLGAAAREAVAPLLPYNPSVGAALGVRTNPLGASFEMQLTISQQLEIAGERGARRRAAGAYDVGLHRRLDQSRFETQVALRWAYASALLAKQRLHTATRVRDFTGSLVHTAKRQVEAGDLAPLRLRMAEASLAQATQARREAARVYRAACRQLATTAGWPAAEPIAPVGELGDVSSRLDADALVSEALERHPELVALAQELRAARAGLRAAKRDAWPEPTIGAYAAREHEPGSPFASRVGLITVSVPLPLWRRNQGPRAQAKAQLRIAEVALATRRYELEQELRRSIDAVQTAAARVQDYGRDVLPRFDENLELLQRAFELGEIDIIGVAVGRQSFFDAQAAALETWSDYLAAVRQLELAVGRPVVDTMGAAAAPMGSAGPAAP